MNSLPDFVNANLQEVRFINNQEKINFSRALEDNIFDRNLSDVLPGEFDLFCKNNPSYQIIDVDAYGRNVIMKAAQSCNVWLLSHLVNKVTPSILDMRDIGGFTALFKAVLCDSPALSYTCLRILLQGGADPALCERTLLSGDRPLYYYYYQFMNKEVVKRGLLHHSWAHEIDYVKEEEELSITSLKEPPVNSFSLLFIDAVSSKKSKSAEFTGNTPLFCAASMKSLPIVSIFIKYAAPFKSISEAEKGYEKVTESEEFYNRTCIEIFSAEWTKTRLLFLGHQKNTPPLSTIPTELIQRIFNNYFILDV